MTTIDSFNSWNAKINQERSRVQPTSKIDNDQNFKRFYYNNTDEDNIIDVEYTEESTIPEKFILRLYNASGEAISHILTMSKERGIFIDQSQSQNLWMKDPTYDKLTAMHFYAYRCGLKTGIYYLRTKAKAAPQQFTIDPSVKPAAQSLDEGCEMCSG